MCDFFLQNSEFLLLDVAFRINREFKLRIAVQLLRMHSVHYEISARNNRARL